jgi:type II secretion system protein G
MHVVRVRRGFTLIEMLVVVAIIGIITAMAVANLVSAVQRAKQKRTMGDMRTVALAIESYSTDFNRYPAAAGFVLPSGLSLPSATLDTAASQLTPTYIKMVPMRDGWNSWFTYGTSPSQFDYVLRSNGADGLPEAAPAYGISSLFDSDIILVDGTFVQYPQGVQK